MSSVIDALTAEVINNLLRELASELDLHYEEGDFFALTPTLDRMKAAATLVEKNGFELPDSYRHILRRYNMQRQ
ncbi:hypothetical protein [Mesorhizobium sp. STM 4661]|uniref:hypothetical protein n=1 Tax=Mesorhizobium sp. STM 4661 TaxID=1297570 RepID=UPI0002BECD3B|nr:hypothetical protein [Mesorhizobium sp. STM 4661]CCV12987.1 hypothetical protein MESS4_510154 [Mesorhizobium sp. STM 4661]